MDHKSTTKVLLIFTRTCNDNAFFFKKLTLINSLTATACRDSFSFLSG